MKFDLSGNRRNPQIPADSYMIIPRAWAPLAASLAFSWGPPSNPGDVWYLFTLNHEMVIGGQRIPVVDFNKTLANPTHSGVPKLCWDQRNALDAIWTFQFWSKSGPPLGSAYVQAPLKDPFDIPI